MLRVMAANSSSSTTYVVLSSPEFSAENTGISDLAQPDRVLIGGGAAGGGTEAERAVVERAMNLVWLYAHWVPSQCAAINSNSAL